MRKTREEIVLSGQFIDDATGEVLNMSATHQIDREYYSIKRFNMKMWRQGYNWAMGKVCKSSLDIQIFSYIVDNIKQDNMIYLSRKEVSELFNVSTVKVSQLLKRMTDINFVDRIERGVYRVNPFVLYPSNRPNKEIEFIQNGWKHKFGVPSVEKINRNGKL
jgi:predicted transcriptional regulator